MISQQPWLHFFIILGLAAMLSYIINFFLVKHAHALQLIDVPNYRSSHATPTPRGGGVGIVIGFSITMFCIWFWQAEPLKIWSIILVSWIIAAIGLYDDVISCSALTRIIFHTIAIALLLFCIGYRIEYAPVFFNLHTTWLVVGILFIAGIWSINLFNFMDGIDGLAVLEAIYVLAAAAITLYWQKQNSAVLSVIITLLGACIGFLNWNRPKARIFMGDVGSSFLGFMIAAMACYTIINRQLPATTWLIWLSVFWIDASYTLAIRMVTGQRWVTAHRSHMYQILARRWQSHAYVDFAVLAYNIIWLLPLSTLCILYPAYSLIWLITAILPLVGLCIYAEAGRVND